MIHGMRCLQDHHAVIAGQFFHFRRRLFAAHEKQETYFRHFGRTDSLQVAQTGNQQNAVAIERQDIAHQVAGKRASRLFIQPVGAADDSRLG